LAHLALLVANHEVAVARICKRPLRNPLVDVADENMVIAEFPACMYKPTIFATARPSLLKEPDHLARTPLELATIGSRKFQAFHEPELGFQR
jgi:hypothetical protein